MRKGYLGLSTAPLTPALAQELDIDAKQGAIVVEVQAGGPGDAAGLHGLRGENQVGDIILSIDGQPLKDPGDLARIIGSHKPSDKVTLGILRQKRQQQVEVTLGNRPEEVRQPKSRGLLDWLR